MGIIAKNDQEKSQLATEICELSARAIACAKFHQPCTNISPFINWYLVLRISENAEIDCIRKQYHKLALHLHPDKNKHSKAETAFKLVSEAYSCLSDNERRAAFDSRRKTISCTSCNTTNCPSSTNEKAKMPPSRNLDRAHIKRMKELRAKLKEEATIINKCLTSNATAAASRKASPYTNGKKTELPVFDPSDYQHKGYPHNRSMINHKKLEDLRAAFMIGNRCMMMHNKMAMQSSPV